jgi:hypothetical protein
MRMLSRRTFLQASLSVTAVPLLSPLTSAEALSAPLNILVFAEDVCPDSRRFARSLGARHLGADPSEQLQALQATLASEEYDAVFGLTRNSNQFLIEQYGQAQRYYPSYKGVHEYNEQGLLHQLNGDKEVVAALADNLLASPSQWATAIAASAPLICRSCAPTISQVIQTSVSRPQESPGYLVSWMLQRST